MDVKLELSETIIKKIQDVAREKSKIQYVQRNKDKNYHWPFTRKK